MVKQNILKDYGKAKHVVGQSWTPQPSKSISPADWASKDCSLSEKEGIAHNWAIPFYSDWPCYKYLPNAGMNALGDIRLFSYLNLLIWLRKSRLEDRVWSFTFSILLPSSKINTEIQKKEWINFVNITKIFNEELSWKRVKQNEVQESPLLKTGLWSCSFPWVFMLPYFY